MPSFNGLGNPKIKPRRQNIQIKFEEAQFDAEIARALTASGWRVAAALLTLAAKLIEVGDFLDAERDRQIAREQFIAANYIFRQFQEERAVKGASLWAVPPRHHLRLVLPPPSPRPRRLEVRISVADGRAPHGRSRLFRLIERDLDELIAVATRLEFRSSRGAR